MGKWERRGLVYRALQQKGVLRALLTAARRSVRPCGSLSGVLQIALSGARLREERSVREPVIACGGKSVTQVLPFTDSLSDHASAGKWAWRPRSEGHDDEAPGRLALRET